MSSARSKNTSSSSLSRHDRGLEALARLMARVAAREFITVARQAPEKKTQSKALPDD